MSYFDTKQACIQQLLTSTINSDLIGYENKNFDPKNLDEWFATYFIPASTEMMGKTLASSDEQRGVFQVSAFVAVDNEDFDNKQLKNIDTILSAFRYGTRIVYNNQTVDILESTVTNGSEQDSWFKRDISINYLTFSKR